MAACPSGFASAVAELARQAARFAEEDDADVRLSRRAMDAAMRAADDLAALARAAPQESYDAAESAVQAVAAELALARARTPRRLAVVLEVQVDDGAAV